MNDGVDTDNPDDDKYDNNGGKDINMIMPRITMFCIFCIILIKQNQQSQTEDQIAFTISMKRM
jgi:preprotein translocase subunit YajC